MPVSFSSAFTPSGFRFLSDDVRKQQQTARSIAEQARRLKEILEDEDSQLSEQSRKKLASAIEQLANDALALSDNALQTSSSAVNYITSVSSGSST
jgi:uncharacterized protein (DUF2342 family)